MSDVIEMAPLPEDKKESEHNSELSIEPFPDLSPNIVIQRDIPNTWKYKSIWFLGLLHLPHFASPEVQLVLVSLICFLNPGLYNALSGLGGAGQVDARVFDVAQTVLYSTFAIVGFFGGTVTNRLGIRRTLALGATGYALFGASFLCFNHTQNSGFVIFAGSALGVSAPLLWTAQGAVMLAYPPEGSKGKFFSWFWSVFNFGAVLGSLIPLSANIHTDRVQTVSDSTYIVFIALMASGCLLALLMCNGDEVVRSDGSWVVMPPNPTWETEVWALWQTLKLDTYVILLFPMFICSNWFYTYQFNGFNQAHFNIRTRALNNTLYWVSQIIGAMVFGYSVDNNRYRRSVKAKACWVMLLTLTTAIWGAGLAWQRSVPDRRDGDSVLLPAMDWKDKSYWMGMLLYIAYGFFDAVWQACVYWYLGALTNSGRKTAYFAGFYKGIQSAGAAISWRMDSLGMSFMKQFITIWSLLTAGILFAFPIIFFKINDHTKEDDFDNDGGDQHATDDLESSQPDTGNLGSKSTAVGIITDVDKPDYTGPPGHQLEPQDETHVSHSISQYSLPASQFPLEEFPKPLSEGDVDGLRQNSFGGTTRSASRLTVEQAVDTLEGEVVVHEAQEISVASETTPAVLETNRFSRAFAEHLRTSPHEPTINPPNY